MADDSSLTVNITANADPAAAGIASVDAAFDALMAKMAQTTSAGAALTASHAAIGASAESAAAKETLFGESIGRVETAANSAARAASAFGLETEAALGRVEAFSGALEGLGKAAVPLLAIGAAVLAVAEAFNALKDGVDEAAKAQVAMATLGQAVENQGGAWNEAAQSGVDRFLTAIQTATTYSRGEALEALNSLVTAGFSLADAEKTVAVATDVAAGSHRALIDVVDKVKEAMAGHGRGLLELDEDLKPLIADHAHLSSLLDGLSSKYAGEASAAADTYAGSVERLQNQLGYMAEQVGERLLPALTTGAEILIGFAQSAEDHVPQIEHFFDTVISSAEHATRTLSDLGRMANWALAAATGNVAEMMQSAQGAGSAAGDFGHLVGADFGMKDPGADQGNFSKFIASAQARAKADEANADKILQGFREQALQNDPTVGSDQKGSKSIFDFQAPAMPNLGEKDPDGDQEKALNEQLKALTASELTYTNAVADATTKEGQHAAEMAKAAAVTRDAHTAIVDIAIVMDAEQKKVDALNAELSSQGKAYSQATAAYRDYGKAIGSSPTEAEKNHLKDLKTAMDNAGTAFHATRTEVGKLNDLYQQNSDKIVELVPKLNTLAAATAEGTRATNEAADAERKRLASLDAERAAQVENLKTENALYGESLAQQLAFYRQRDANEIAAGEKGTDQEKADFAKIISLEGDEYKQRLDAQKAFITSAQALESSFIDTILTKHQSLRDDLHDIFQSIEADFAKMLEQMLLKSSILNSLNSSLEKIFNVGGGGGYGGTAGGIAGGSGLSSLLNSSIVTGVDTPGSNSVIDVGSNTNLALTGSTTGVSPAQASAGFGTADISNGAGGGDDFATGGASGLSKALGGALEGAGIGSLLAGITGGNATFGSLGGALGGAVGSIFSPVGGLIGSAAGSLLGGLFGSKATPATSPDIYNTQQYGQGVANLTGQEAGANGQYFYSNVEGQTGGLGEIAYIEEALAGATQITSGSQAGWYTTASGQQLNPQQYQQLVSAFGISATGSGQLNFGHNIGQQWITGAQGASSTPESYSQLDALAASFLSSSGGANASIPVFTVGRTYPDLNKGTLNADGTYSQSNNQTTVSTAPAAGKTGTGTGAASSDTMIGTPETGRGLPGGITLTVNLNGASFLTAKNIQDTTDAIAQSMSKSLQRYGVGTLAGGIAGISRTRNGNI